jgi:hypothetical protein
LLAEGARSFNDRCAAGIAPNEKRIQEHLVNSLMLVAALNPHIGYEKSAQISLKALPRRPYAARRRAAARLRHGGRVRRMGTARGHDAPALDGVVDSRMMINHGGAGRTGCSLAGQACRPYTNLRENAT